MKKSKAAVILAVILVVLTGMTWYAGTIVSTVGVGASRNIKLGLDLAGGVSITYKAVDKNPSAEDMKDTVYKLQKRVEKYSTEASVYQEGSDRISIEIPGVSDANTILEEMGKPGSLEFQTSDGQTILSGSDIKDAQPKTYTDDKGQKQNVVALTLTDEGTKKFADATQANLGKSIPIVYDGETISSPTVQSVISDGNAQITGMESYEAADELASTIRIGSLSLELKELNSKVVGAQLGTSALSGSLMAAVIGLVLVILFMIVMYRISGFASGIALILYSALMVWALWIFDITLTLPGIAGIILSIGMAVDANVIIFTRIKEELGKGASVKSAIDAGFDKALSAILDGNITTLIAAVVLYIMGIGSIKGFALTLGIGIALSMFTALFVTKHLLKAVFTLGLQSPKLYGAKKEPKVRGYVKFSKVAYTISIIAIAAGLIALPVFKSKTGSTLNYSLEFTGGTSMTVNFEERYDLAKAESDILPVIAKAANISEADVQVQNVQNSNEIVFKTSELSNDQREAVQAALEDNFKIKEFNMENISSTISSEMQRNAIVSVLIATILMLIYIAIRFSDVKFGAAAVVALLHDVLVVFAVYSIGRLSVGNTFIACMLTIVGYSINATIIIFDRIRENMVTMSKDNYATIVDTSISQTLTRTIYTSLTTFVMVFVLYIMGVTSIKEFALTLMCGIVCGAYSSVCITGPLWYMLKTKMGKQDKNTGSKKIAKKKAKNA